MKKQELNERLQTYGANHLNDLEIAYLVGGFKGTREELYSSSFLHLARNLVARTMPHEMPKQITSSTDSVRLLTSYGFHMSDVEEFWMLTLTRNNRVIRARRISIGGVSGTLVDAKIIFSEAINDKASAIILSHNHPSGNLKPSQADIQLTRKLKQGADLLDMQVLDHVILSHNPNCWYSFADEGMMS